METPLSQGKLESNDNEWGYSTLSRAPKLDPYN